MPAQVKVDVLLNENGARATLQGIDNLIDQINAKKVNINIGTSGSAGTGSGGSGGGTRALQDLATVAAQAGYKMDELGTKTKSVSTVVNGETKKITETYSQGVGKMVQLSSNGTAKITNDLAAQSKASAKATADANKMRDQYNKAMEDMTRGAVKEGNAYIQQMKAQEAAEAKRIAEAEAAEKAQQQARLQRFAQIGTAMAATFVVKNVKEALSTMKDVDSELANIRKVTDESADSIARLGDRAYSTASKYGITATEYLANAADFAKAGYKNYATLSELAIKTQLVGDVSAETASKFLLSADAAYKMGGNVEQLSTVLDKANVIENNFATSIYKIAEGFPIVASTASMANMSIDETMAALGTITAKTQETGRKAATALRALILNIEGEIGAVLEDEQGQFEVTEESVKSMSDALKKYGNEAVKAAKATGKLIDPMEAVRSLSEAYKSGELSDQELYDILEKLGGKLRINQITTLVKNFDTFEQMLGMTKDAAGSADRELGYLLDTWNAKSNILKNTWTEFVKDTVSAESFKGLLDGLNTFVGLLDTAVLSLQALGEGFGTLFGFLNVGKEGGLFGDLFKGIRDLIDPTENAQWATDNPVAEVNSSLRTAIEFFKLLKEGKSIQEAGRIATEHYEEALGALNKTTEDVNDAQENLGDIANDVAEGFDDATNAVDSATDALTKFSNATATTKSGSADSYRNAYQQFLSDYKSGKTDSNVVRAAADLLLPPEVQKALGYDLQAMGKVLASDLYKGIYNGASGNAGVDFVNYMAENMTKSLDKIVNITKNKNGTYNFEYASVEKLAEYFKLPVPAIQALINSLDEFGVHANMGWEEADNLATSLGLVGEKAVKSKNGIKDVVKSLSGMGYNDPVEIRKALDALEGGGYLDLSKFSSKKIGQLISEALEEASASVEGAEKPKVEVDTTELEEAKEGIKEIPDKQTKVVNIKVTGLEDLDRLKTLVDASKGEHSCTITDGGTTANITGSLEDLDSYLKLMESGPYAVTVNDDGSIAIVKLDAYNLEEQLSNMEGNPTVVNVNDEGSITDVEGKATTLSSVIKEIEGDHPSEVSAEVTGTVETNALADAEDRVTSKDEKVNADVTGTEDAEALASAEEGIFSKTARIYATAEAEKAYALLDAWREIQDKTVKITTEIVKKADENAAQIEEDGSLWDYTGFNTYPANEPVEVDVPVEVSFEINKNRTNGWKARQQIDELTQDVGEDAEFEIKIENIDFAQDNVEALYNDINQIPGVTEVYFEDDALVAKGNVDSLYSAIAKLPSEKTITISIVTNGSLPNVGGGLPGRAKGTKNAPGGLSLVNELGPELISDNGRAYIANGGKPAIVNLGKGAIVLTAEETRQALNGASVSNGIGAYAKGTALILADRASGGVGIDVVAQSNGNKGTGASGIPATGKKKTGWSGGGSGGSSKKKDKDEETSDPWKDKEDALKKDLEALEELAEWYHNQKDHEKEAETYQKAIEKVDELRKKYLKAGFDETAKEVTTLANKIFDYEEDIADAKAHAIEDLEDELDNLESQIELAENQGDLQRMLELQGEAQKKVSELIEAYRAAGFSDTSPEILKLANMGFDYASDSGSTMKDLWENLIDALEEMKDIQDEANDLAEKQLAVDEAREALQNAQNQRTVRVFNPITGQWEWVADSKSIQQAEESLKNAEEDLLKEQQSQELDAIKKAMENGGSLNDVTIGPGISALLSGASLEQTNAFASALGVLSGGLGLTADTSSKSIFDSVDSHDNVTQYTFNGVTIDAATAENTTLAELTRMITPLALTTNMPA